jgi:hypothetical protein
MIHAPMPHAERKEVRSVAVSCTGCASLRFLFNAHFAGQPDELF